MKKSYALLTATVAGLLLTGCIPALIGAGATTGGVLAAQERSAGNAVDDATIKLTINNIFIKHDINDLFKNVDVHVTEGRVLLTGDVNKTETKVDAVRLAWRASGVREVMDEIQVNDKTGIADYARDAWISAQVRSRLLFEKNLRSINYNIETVNGVVYMMGIAQDKEELDKATYIAGTTKYVKQVVSHVVMKDDPRRRPYAKPSDVQDNAGSRNGQDSYNSSRNNKENYSSRSNQDTYGSGSGSGSGSGNGQDSYGSSGNGQDDYSNHGSRN